MANLLVKIQESIVKGDYKEAEQNTRRALDAGLNPAIISESGLEKGMEIVGERFSRWEYFIDDVVLSVRAAKKVIDVLRPKLGASAKIGTVVIGTVEGDIHDLGRMLVARALESTGFEVYDLGSNVPREKFVEKANEFSADIVGLSALVTTTMGEMKNVVKAFEEAGIRDKVRIVIGGTPVSKAFAEQIGADAYAADMLDGVRVCKGILKKR